MLRYVREDNFFMSFPLALRKLSLTRLNFQHQALHLVLFVATTSTL